MELGFRPVRELNQGQTGEGNPFFPRSGNLTKGKRRKGIRFSPRPGIEPRAKEKGASGFSPHPGIEPRAKKKGEFGVLRVRELNRGQKIKENSVFSASGN